MKDVPADLPREERIRRAQRMAEFVDDPIVNEAVARLSLQYYAEFKKAKTAEERARAQDKAVVIDDLLLALKITLDDGEMAVRQIAQDVKKESQKRTF